MSDGGTGEKTEEPTPEKLRKLREEGQVPKSQDVTSAVSFICTFAVLAATAGYMGDEMVSLVETALSNINSGESGEVLAHRLMVEGIWTMAKVCAPALATAFVLGLAMNIAQVGFMITTKPITPDPNKLNPVNGVKNLINMKKLVELLKTIIKFVVISWLSYAALQDAIRDVIFLIQGELTMGMKVVGGIIWDFCTKIGGAFVAIAAFDAFYQRKRFTKDNMMSKYDVKQEYKQSEGDPQLKGERKQLHREMINGGGVSNVKNADVVVKNPEHIAVALQYDKEVEDAAPVVVAKGQRIWAEKILDEARRHNVPIVRNVPLAHALNKVEIGDEIPEELFDAVAEVLNFVYTLSEAQAKKSKRQ